MRLFLTGLSSLNQAQALIANNRLGWKSLTGTNTLAHLVPQ
jgi:hypothetical protein